MEAGREVKMTPVSLEGPECETGGVSLGLE